MYIHAARVLNRVRDKSITHVIRMPCTSNVHVHTIRAARVQTAFTVHSRGTHSRAFMLLFCCTRPTRDCEILKCTCSTHVAYMSEVCAMRVLVCN